MKGLSGKQKEVLIILMKHKKERGFPPTVREIGEIMGYKSSSTVHNHLTALEVKGYIRRSPGSPRAIEVLREIG